MPRAGLEISPASISRASLSTSRQKFQLLSMSRPAPDAVLWSLTVDVMASRCEATTLHENPEAGALDGDAVPAGGMNGLRAIARG